jgi:aquaporin Z
MVPKKKGKEGANLCSKLLAEFLGTFVLCVTVQLVVNGGSAIGAIGIACSLMVMIYALGAVSGANFNPAVSFGLLLDGELKCLDFVLYVFAQLAGAVFAFFVAWCLLKELKVALVVKHITGDVGGAAGADWFAVLLSELIFTAMLVFTVLNVAVYDGGNQYYGLAIGFVIIVGAASVGSVSGGCFNPAVALTLDLSAWIVGGAEYGWSWLYFLMQMIAAAVAVALTKAVRCTHGHDKELESEPEEEAEESEEEAFQ